MKYLSVLCFSCFLSVAFGRTLACNCRSTFGMIPNTVENGVNDCSNMGYQDDGRKDKKLVAGGVVLDNGMSGDCSRYVGGLSPDIISDFPKISSRTDYAMNKNISSPKVEAVTGDIKKELKKGFLPENNWYKISQKGKYGAMDLQGNIIVPMEYTDVSDYMLSVFYIAKTDNLCALYSREGKLLIPIQRGYTDIEYDMDYGYFKVRKGKYVGVCEDSDDDNKGRELISPDRHYTNMFLEKENGIKFFVVEKNGKHGVCTYDGKEIVAPQYKQMGISTNGTLAYMDSNNNCHDLFVKPDGSRVYTTSNKAYNSYASTQPTQKKKGNGFWRALGTGLLGAAAVVAQSQTQHNYAYSAPRSNYSGSSSYYSSPAYVRDVQARADRTMANFNNQMQQMISAAGAQANYDSERITQANIELLQWAGEFEKTNGRAPSELEKDQWMQQHYPQYYQSYIMAKYGGANVGGVHESETTSNQSQDETLKDKNKQYWKDRKNRPCQMCVGKGGITGQCFFCYKGYNNGKRCVTCKTTPGVCEYCHGTGKAAW